MFRIKNIYKNNVLILFFTKILCLAFLSLWISIKDWNQSSIKEKNVKDMNSCSFIVYVYGSFMQTILIYS